MGLDQLLCAEGIRTAEVRMTDRRNGKSRAAGAMGRINRLAVPGGPNRWRRGTGKNELDAQEEESMSLGFYQYKGII